jgi:hypothetical protein
MGHPERRKAKKQKPQNFAKDAKLCATWRGGQLLGRGSSPSCVPAYGRQAPHSIKNGQAGWGTRRM